MGMLKIKPFSARQIIGFCAISFCLYCSAQLVNSFVLLQTVQTKLGPQEMELLKAPLEEEIIHSYFQQGGKVTTSHLSSQNSLQSQVQQEMQNFINEKSLNREDTEQLLQNLVRDSYVCLFYERTYQRILGSQIKLMEYLEFHLGRYFSEKELYEVFEKNVPSPHRNITAFKKWLKYLERSYFIQEQEGKVCLTNSGLEFLNYIRKQSYSLCRPG